MAEPAQPWVLGISASHNGAACLLRGDEIAVAIQEERLLRSKRARIHSASPTLAVRYVLDEAGIGPADLASVVLCAQGSNRDPATDIRLNPVLQLGARGIPHHAIPHHLGHAIAAFATSGFEEAAAVIVDGHGSPVGDLPPDELASIHPALPHVGWEGSSIYACRGAEVKAVEKHVGEWYWNVPGHVGMNRFGSLGGMYGAVGRQIFGDPMDGAGKVMGLAPYGTPDVPVQDFFDVVDGLIVYSSAVPDRYTHTERWPARQAEYQNLAASVQRALEEALLHLARRAREKTGADRLVLAGGVALNSVANERILREAGFKEVFIQPAAEDSGTAIGAAYHGLWKLTGRNARRKLQHDAVGRVYRSAEIDRAIAEAPCVVASRPTDVVAETVRQLVAGKIVGWFEGRSELGPRALGQRSILCDPRGAGTKDVLNARVKHREGFRPFAPVILLEEANAWFELDGVSHESPSMLRVASFRPDKRALVPAVVHVDGTGRIQTVTREANGRLYEIVRAFHRETGVPIVLNTSFNVAGEPIVETPADALWCLLYTGVDVVVLDDRVVHKRDGYRSILELAPRLSAEWVVTASSKASGRPRASAGDLLMKIPVDTPIGIAAAAVARLEADAERLMPEYARFLVATPWGPAAYVSEVGLVRVLDHVDGKRSGTEILARLQADGQALDEPAFVRILGRMRRANIISMHAAS